MTRNGIRVLITLCLICSAFARPDPTADCDDEDYDFTPKPTLTTAKNAVVKVSAKLAVANPSKLKVADGENIIFPGETSPHSIHTRMPEIKVKNKRQCVGNLCEEVDNYPQDFITNVLSTNSIFSNYFSDDYPQFSIADRNQFTDEGQNLCQATVRTLYPKTATNLNRTERIIVNVDNYQQGVQVEMCSNEVKCKFSENFPNNHEAFCQQRHTVKRLMALDDDKKPVFDSFEVPSCCVCIYKKKDI